MIALLSLELIFSVVISCSTDDGRQRSVVIRTVKSLDDLSLSLLYEGFELNIIFGLLTVGNEKFKIS